MKKLPQITVLVSLALASTMLQAAPLELNCRSSDTEKEPVRIKKLAAGVVARKAAHVLQVSTKAGVQSFKDEPPYDEPTDGVQYNFCDRLEGFVLVNVQDGTEFSGKLVNEQTGAVTEGGAKVSFSEDRRAYLATDYAGGLDGDIWKIFAVSGKQSWSGYNFITAGEQRYRYVDLGTPTWMPNGELVATATCSSDRNRKWTMKLVKNYGQWDWAPRKKCPPHKEMPFKAPA